MLSHMIVLFLMFLETSILQDIGNLKTRSNSKNSAIAIC